MLYCRSKRESKQRKANPVFTEGLGGDGGSNVGPDEGCGTHLNPCSVPALGHGSSALCQHSCQGFSGHWQPGSVPRAQSLQRGSALLGGDCEIESAAASMGCSGSAVSFWSSRKGFGEIISWLCPALFPPQEPGGAAWVTAWHLEQRSPRHSSTLCRAMGLPDPVPFYSWTQGLLGGVSRLLSSWESPGYPSEALPRMWQWPSTALGRETHQGCVHGTPCQGERGCCGELGRDEPRSRSSAGE